MLVYIPHNWILARVGPYGPSGLLSIPSSGNHHDELLSTCQHIPPDYNVPGNLAQLAQDRM